jgi:hypothetical protein
MNKIERPTLDDLGRALGGEVKIKLTKLSEAPDPLHPNNIKEGEYRIGYIPKGHTPIVGKSFVLPSVININGDAVHPGHWFVTSEIQEVIDPLTFRTLNSVYKIELL